MGTTMTRRFGLSVLFERSRTGRQESSSECELPSFAFNTLFTG